MRIAGICYTESGEELLKKLRGITEEIEIDLFIKPDAKDIAKNCFAENIPMLFVCACGIAVRSIAPYIKDKLLDPPVLVMDESGRFVIPILSGHVGGGNALAKKIADLIGAEPVITTATDVNDTFSIDEFARENALTINNRDNIKKVSSKVLKNEPIRIQVSEDFFSNEADVVISENNMNTDALWLSPKRYVLGIGCKKGKTVGEIEALADEALDALDIDYSDIYAFGSIDLKKDEEGLLSFSAKHRLPFFTFSGNLLKEARGSFSASDFVKATTGVDNVCERSAVLLTGNRGELVLTKRCRNGVTVAVARRF